MLGEVNFVTPTSIATVGVATFAVEIVTTALHNLLKAPPKWTAFITSTVIAYLVVGIQGNAHWYDWILAFVNACLLFCSALGINELGASALKQPGSGVVGPKPVIKSWFNR